MSDFVERAAVNILLGLMGSILLLFAGIVYTLLVLTGMVPFP